MTTYEPTEYAWGFIEINFSEATLWSSLANVSYISLQWRHNKRHGISNHQHLDCLLSRLFRRTPKKIWKRITGLCEGDPPVTGEFLSQRARGKHLHLMTSSCSPIFFRIVSLALRQSYDCPGVISEATLRDLSVSVSNGVTNIPDNKVHGANMGPIWGRQDPGGPHVAPWTLLSGIKPLAACRLWSISGLNIKISSNQYRDFHYKEKTVSWCQSYTWKDILYIEMGPWNILVLKQHQSEAWPVLT